jgi:hypothetical protein
MEHSCREVEIDEMVEERVSCDVVGDLAAPKRNKR